MQHYSSETLQQCNIAAILHKYEIKKNIKINLTKMQQNNIAILLHIYKVEKRLNLLI